MQGLTIHEAAQTTGWSARMLRYLEDQGLIEPTRSGSGYRLYGAGELQRLRTLRELLEQFECGLSDVAFAKRMSHDQDLRQALDNWFEETPKPPAGVSGGDWLSWEQKKHERLIDTAA